MVDGTYHAFEVDSLCYSHIGKGKDSHSSALSTSKELTVNCADCAHKAALGCLASTNALAIFPFVDHSVVATRVSNTLFIEAGNAVRGHWEVPVDAGILLVIANGFPELDVLGTGGKESGATGLSIECTIVDLVLTSSLFKYLATAVEIKHKEVVIIGLVNACHVLTVSRDGTAVDTAGSFRKSEAHFLFTGGGIP